MLFTLKPSPLLKNILKSIAETTSHTRPQPLGRWNMEACSEKTKNKIDLANEDHCGPCGQYAMQKVELEKIHHRMNKLEKKTNGLQHFLTKY